MCGIVGAIRTKHLGVRYTDIDMVEQLLRIGVLRGEHGTGLYHVSQEGRVATLKIGGTPEELFRSKPFSKFWETPKKKNVSFIVGHNRFATKGKQTTNNAHPFMVGNTTLVHNGTINSFLNFPDHKKYEVDSQALCASIDAKGIDETVNDVYGAYAVVYYDMVAKTLNMLRNEDRPLAIAIDEKEESVIFASEPGMLYWILHRNKEDNYKVEMLPAHKLYTFNLTNFDFKVREVRKVYNTRYYNDAVTDYEPHWTNTADELPANPDDPLTPPSTVCLPDKTKEPPVSTLEQSDIIKEARRSKNMSRYIPCTGKYIGVEKMDPLIFVPTTWSKLNEETIEIEGYRGDMTKTIIIAHLKGNEDTALELFDSAEGVKGIIRNIMISRDGSEHNKIFVSHLESNYEVLTNDETKRIWRG